jgi:hypothetical protein
MHGALDPDHVPLHLILHIILEGHLPRRQTRGFMVEDEAIFSFQMIQTPIMKTSIKKAG